MVHLNIDLYFGLIGDRKKNQVVCRNISKSLPIRHKIRTSSRVWGDCGLEEDQGQSPEQAQAVCKTESVELCGCVERWLVRRLCVFTTLDNE